MSEKHIIRVFPRRTRATPEDPDVRVGDTPGFALFEKADEVHISVSFSWDVPLAERLARQWEHVAPVKIGGPATGMRGEDFVPGMYLRKGYVITSRGCPNKCWYCSVWRREGNIRELPITDGWNVLDDNLLACSREHIESVFSMLSRQKCKPEFTGGLEAARLESWHAEYMKSLKTRTVFFAYDSNEKYEALCEAGETMRRAGFVSHDTKGKETQSHALRCYVLCGYPRDTIPDAEKRMTNAVSAGFMPMAMVYMDSAGKKNTEWGRWARTWIRPAIVSEKGRSLNVSR